MNNQTNLNSSDSNNGFNNFQSNSNINNSYTMSSQSNNQFMNNNISNPNNSFTCENSNQNLNSVYNNISSTSNKKGNNKILLLVVLLVIIVLVIIFAIFGLNKSGHKNTTGSSKYSDSEVDLNCISDLSEGNKIDIMYVDILSDYEGYQLVTYFKIVLGYNDGTRITDEKYKKILESSYPAVNLSKDDYSKNYIELGATTYGFDTTVTRSENEVVFIANRPAGMGFTATKDDIKLAKETYEKAGFICN